ncbi:MAG: hypothetical protein GXY74_02370 [Phycisphaerae bacterium]|nr:hypothetical protein [Phycisphaerae bacterium]
MFRRTMTIIISVLAMVFLALLLRHLQKFEYGRVVGLFKVDPQDVTQETSGAMEVGEAGTAIAESDFEIIVRDPETNRLRYVIRARKMAPEPGTTRTHLVEPEFFIYSDKGEVVNVRAPNGYFDTVGGPLNGYDDISRGRLTDGVVLRHDRGTPADPADDVVITLDHMDYVRVATMDDLPGGEGDIENAPVPRDTPLSKLFTDDPVTVRSPEGDVDAVGMVLYLVRGKSDLRQLRLLDKVHVVLRTGSDRFGVSLLGEDENEGGRDATPPSPRPSPVGAPSRGGSSGRPATAGGATGRSAAASAPSPVSSAAATDTDQRLMHLLLVRNVRAVQGDRRLEGDRVTLLVPDKSSSKKGSDAKAGDAPVPGASTSERPPAAQSSGAAARTGRSGDQPGTTASASTPADAPGKTRNVVPLDIVCDGPLVLTPQAVHGPPVKFQIAATGSPVLLVDKGMEARGEYFQYDDTSKKGRLRGSDARDATVVQNEATVTGRQFTFDQVAGTARVDGRGSLVGKVGGRGLGLGAAAAQGDADESFHARWNDWMSITHEPHTVAVDGKEQKRNFIQVADFSGKAALWRGRQTLAGDRIRIGFFRPTADGTQAVMRLEADGQVAASQPEGGGSMAIGDLVCEHLDADFVRLPDGGSRVGAMHASGKVRGAGKDKSSKAGDLEAEKLWITFKEDPTDPKSAKPSTVRAETDVRVRQEGYYAEADTLNMTDDGERVELRGTRQRQALVTSGANKLRGEKIVALNSAQRADVTGPGSLSVLSSRGPEGEKLKEPMPLNITWTESMFFDGKANQSHFMGDARARTPAASVDCRDLWVFFTDRPKDAARSNAAGEDDASKLIGEKDLSRLTAIENVVARVVQTPEDPTKLVSVSTIESQKLEYNAEKEKAYVPGAGVLTVIEVDRTPAAKPPHERTARTSTRVAWKKEMIFERQRAVAYFGEDVVARVVGRSQGLIPQDKDVGRLSGTSTLWCQDLRLFFAETAAADASGKRRIDLQQLVATDRVFFKDGDYHARGARLTYDLPQDMLVLTRSQAQPAAIWVQNEQRQIFDRWGGDKLFYYREKREVKAIGPREITVTARDMDAFK